MPCIQSHFIEHINEDNYLNFVFEKEDIPIQILYYDLHEKDSKQQIIDFLNESKQCYHELREDDVPIVIFDLKQQKIIAVIILKVYPQCIYIVYRCVHPNYRGQGWGEFLTFLSIFFANYCGFRFVYASGISDINTTTKYERVGGFNEIAVSQYINIHKFGFEDFYRADTYSMDRARSFATLCGEQAETALDLKLGKLELYETYKSNLLENPRQFLKRFLDIS